MGAGFQPDSFRCRALTLFANACSVHRVSALSGAEAKLENGPSSLYVVAEPKLSLSERLFVCRPTFALTFVVQLYVCSHSTMYIMYMYM